MLPALLLMLPLPQAPFLVLILDAFLLMLQGPSVVLHRFCGFHLVFLIMRTCLFFYAPQPSSSHHADIQASLMENGSKFCESQSSLRFRTLK